MHVHTRIRAMHELPSQGPHASHAGITSHPDLHDLSASPAQKHQLPHILPNRTLRSTEVVLCRQDNPPVPTPVIPPKQKTQNTILTCSSASNLIHKLLFKAGPSQSTAYRYIYLGVYIIYLIYIIGIRLFIACVRVVCMLRHHMKILNHFPGVFYAVVVLPPCRMFWPSVQSMYSSAVVVMTIRPERTHHRPGPKA